jgi:small subunit ribosomal protein S9
MAETEKNSTKALAAEAEHMKLKGRYIGATGRRKTATALIRLYKNGSGLITINGMKADQYFKEEGLLAVINQPMKQSGLLKDFNMTILVSGSGKKSQSEAIRHGITRTLLEINPELRPALKVKGWIMRDARKKERKKPGLKKARRAPQWAKR